MTVTDITLSEGPAHQQRVNTLLDQLDTERRRLYRLKAGAHAARGCAIRRPRSRRRRRSCSRRFCSSRKPLRGGSP